MKTLSKNTGKSWVKDSKGVVENLINGNIKYTYRTRNSSGFKATIDVLKKTKKGNWKKMIEYRWD